MPKIELDADKILSESSEKKPRKYTKKRPKAGEVQIDEPTHLQILEGAINAPSEVLVSIGNYKDLKIVELGFIQSRLYLSYILPTIESTLKQLVPLINSILTSWNFLRNFTTDNINDLRNVINSKESDDITIRNILENWGLPPIDDAELQSLKDAAQSSVSFSNKVGFMILQPIIGSLQEINLSELIMKMTDKLPELTAATVQSALIKQGILLSEETSLESLRKELEETSDIFDMLNVVTAQIKLYKERGKLSNFFAPILSLMNWTQN